MKIFNRWDNSIVIFEDESGTMRETVLAAIALDANLTDANLTDANLTDANLTYANLTYANLTRANLTRANLTDANLTYANLTRANLTWANLTRANLTHIKNDIWDILLRAPGEIDALLKVLREGKVDGSVYEGDCACLVGTIANACHMKLADMEFIKPDSARPAERWFLAIRPGHTPDKSAVVAKTIEWIEEFDSLLERAIAIRTAPAMDEVVS